MKIFNQLCKDTHNSCPQLLLSTENYHKYRKNPNFHKIFSKSIFSGAFAPNITLQERRIIIQVNFYLTLK